MTEKRPLTNPYDWKTARPTTLVENPLRDEIAEALCHGERYQLVGGHGMGKSVLLQELENACRARGAHVVHFQRKASLDYTYRLDDESAVDPAVFPLLTASDSARAYNQAVAVRLELDVSRTWWNMRDLVGAWFKRHPEHGALVLLFDEIDRYVEDGSDSAREFLDSLANANEMFSDRLGVLIAGGLGIYRLRSQLGSAYSGRAKTRSLTPFSRQQLAELVTPFAERGAPLEPEMLDTLRLLTGGIPALATYGLQELWQTDTEPYEPDHLARIFEKFSWEHEQFENHVHRGLGVERGTGPIFELWRRIAFEPGPYPRERLHEWAGRESSWVDVREYLHLLEASGLIRIRQNIRANPLHAERVPSLLWPEDPLAYAGTAIVDDPVEHFRKSLEQQLVLIGRRSLDFMAANRTPVEEKVFSAVIANGLLTAGWQRAEREPLRGPGYADIALTHASFSSLPDAIIEVKHWPRNNYRNAHEQATSYCVEGEPGDQRAAVVMIASLKQDNTLQEWPDTYRRKCLGDDCRVERLEAKAPLSAVFAATRTSGSAAGVIVTHYLLNLAQR